MSQMTTQAVDLVKGNSRSKHEIAYIKNKRFIIPHMRCSGFVRCTRAQGARVAGERCVKEKEELEV